ncbi:hypothetical protein SAMN04488510_12911 [Fervidobacterium changbaicum]|uniref:DUF190 domain-containing protein n=2 Tax=Fervidobacterium TaxID=2422 RepID=A0AAI8CIH4_FERIS|nr:MULTISPECIES: DUF190 domain-containing protein [Fervidobacterium]AMW32127.2 DUF190 domain-containing protein [Fervidobacterium islandicum]QAV33898.1 hypothetical protein CBS1_09415 [Fervidobacterium changbaicum]SDH73170.1 hypothetical protein SAMN04488510_12911 [Fervidobacterium changbaicum]
MEKIIGTFVRIYVKENQKCEAFGKKPLNQVIAEMAVKMDITDFVEYKAFEGYIFDKKIHTLTREVIDHELPIIIEFFTTDEKAQRFLETMAPYLKNAAVLVFRDTEGYFFT